MSFHVVIPARFDSERLPGKPLIDLHGKTMIQRVYEQACKSDASEVIVATDDQRIVDVVTGLGGQTVMTSRDHATGTDRIHEAVSKLGLPSDTVVVNVQGDEPLMPPEAINQVAAAVTGDVPMATLKEPIASASDVFDPNVVKVVTDETDVALYFSRAPVPWDRGAFAAASAQPGSAELAGRHWFRHLGIYAYTVSLLADFVQWPPAPLEEIERLEQLRVLSNGRDIRVLTADCEIPPGVDVQADVDRTVALLASMGY